MVETTRRKGDYEADSTCMRIIVSVRTVFHTTGDFTLTSFGRIAVRWIAIATLVLTTRIGSLPAAMAADDYVAGSPGLLCETPAQIAETLRHTDENNMQASGHLKRCRLIENGSAVRILSRDNSVAKVTAGTGPNAVTGYMPIQSITNARGDPID